MRTSSWLLLSTTLTLLLAGCSGAGAGGAGDDALSDDSSEGALATAGDLADVVLTFDSDKWQGAVAKGGGAASPLAACALADGTDYGVKASSLFMCRDGKYEFLVDVDKNVGRARDLDSMSREGVGLRCAQTPLANAHRAYTCKVKGAAPASFDAFDKADLARVRGFLWLPSSSHRIQKALSDKVGDRLGATKLHGVMSTNAKKCTVEVQTGGDGAVTATLLQDKDDGTSTKLVTFDAPAGTVLGAAEDQGFLALESQQASSSNYSGLRDRKLVVTSDASDGLKVEVISSDSGGASSKYCRKLAP